jgi:hypothetical protein
MQKAPYKGSHQSMRSMLNNSGPCSVVYLHHMQSEWKACLDVLAQQIEAHILCKEDVMLQGLVCGRSIDSIWPKALSYHDRCCWSGPRIWLEPYDRHTCITPTSPSKSRFVSRQNRHGNQVRAFHILTHMFTWQVQQGVGSWQPLPAARLQTHLAYFGRIGT